MPQLLGPDGEPINRQLLTQEIAGPEIVGVRQPLGGHPSDGLTPSRLGTLLRGAEGADPSEYLELAEDMEEKEPQYLTVLGVRKRAVAQLEITIDPASDSARDAEIADFVRLFTSWMNLEDEIFDILDAVGKGYSCTEIIWETSARQWMPKRLVWVDPRFIVFDRQNLRTPLLKSLENGRLDPTGGVPLAPYKFIWFELRAKSGLPMRSGLARAVAWCYLFKNFDIKGWIQFAEQYGRPIRLGKYHAAATAEERRTLLRAVRAIGADAAAIIPQGMEIAFEQPANTSSAADFYERLAKYMDQQISKLVLGQTATTDAIAGGHAVGREHNDVRNDIERADCRALAAVLTDQVIRPMVDLNFGPQKAYPRLRIGRSEQTDIPALVNALSALVPLGLNVSKTEVRSKLGLKEPDSPDDALTAPSSQPASQPVGQALQTALQARTSADQSAYQPDVIDNYVADAIIRDGFEVMSPVISPVFDAIEGATSFDEIRQQLSSAFLSMDNSELQRLVQRGGFNIALYEQAGVLEDNDG